MSATERQVSNFLQRLWRINAEGGQSILGRYGLQNCANVGPSPFQITCALWSSASRRTVTSLKDKFEASHLFQNIDVTDFGHAVARSELEIETYACLHIAVPPTPALGAFEAIGLPNSTLSALSRTSNESLETAAREYSAAAQRQNLKAMIHALSEGVAACHQLGLRTAKQF